MVIEERGELRVAAASGEGVAVRVRIVPVEGSALGALYRAGKPVALDRPRGQDAAWLHELGLEARAVLVEPFSMEGQGGGLVIALRRDGGFRDPDREALQRVRGERRAATGGGALGRDRTAALRHGGARARAHPLGARDPRRDHPGHRARCACSSPTPATSTTRRRCSEAVDDGARGPRRRDRRAAPPDHRASARGARRPRPRRRAGGARAPRAGDRRPGRADRDRPRAREARATSASTPSSRARSTASCRRR